MLIFYYLLALNVKTEIYDKHANAPPCIPLWKFLTYKGTLNNKIIYPDFYRGFKLLDSILK